MLCNSRSLSFVWQKSCQYRQQLLQCQVRNLEWISLEKDPAKLNPRRMPYPEHDLPQPVTYNGPETLRVAYVMDRLPKLMDEEHPFEQEMQDLTEQNSKFYARTQWTSFFEYYKEWKKARTKQGVAAAADEKKGKKATHAKKSSIVHVPDPPELSEQERIELNRTFGTGVMTPVAEVWLKTWKPQPRYTDADFDDNRYSLQRKLQQRLFLIVKDAKTNKWKFPDGVRSNPATMRWACEKQMQQDMDNKLNAYFLTHHPIAHYVTPNNQQDKTFFYHCLYLNGRPPFKKLQAKWADHAWVTRQELLDYEFVDAEYKKVAYDMLWEGYHVTP